MGEVRPAAVSGMFYPADARELDATIAYHLSQAKLATGPVPKALIVPHAGYIYSGTTAAQAYARLAPAHDTIKRVILLGPCHRVAVRGLAASSADAFATPLGDVPIDRDAQARILDLPQVQIFDATHVQEHSLEVHLPFLQRVLDDFTVVPLVVGDATPREVAEVLDILWGGPETVILISSDLSHYHGYEAARALDNTTCKAIEALDGDAIEHEGACGRIPIRGLLDLARTRSFEVTTLDVRNSGDTAGSKDRVVGYGAWAFVEKSPKTTAPESDDFDDATRQLLALHGKSLLRVAARSILHGLEQGTPLPIDPAAYPADLAAQGACFVTLKKSGALRGCIGSSIAHRPLIVDTAVNGFAAAFKDPRFADLAPEEIADLQLSISVLGAPQAMTIKDEKDLLAQLRPNIDGLIIVDQGKRALFLPSVWEGLPRAEEFLMHLKVKAGMPPGHWSPTFQALRFTAQELAADGLDDPAVIWQSPASDA